MTASAPTTFELLVACTGNICRSPAAERLLTAGLGADSGVRVHSAGTVASVGEPASAPMAALRRTFTLRELARLVHDVDPAALPAGPPAQRLAALLPLAAAARGTRPVVADDDDVTDPYGRGDQVYAAVLDQIAAATDAVLRPVRG